MDIFEIISKEGKSKNSEDPSQAKPSHSKHT